MHVSCNDWSLTQGPIMKLKKKNIKSCRFWKSRFFWVGHFDFFLASFSWKQVKVYWLASMCQNFDKAKHFAPECTCKWEIAFQCLSSPVKWRNQDSYFLQLMTVGSFGVGVWSPMNHRVKVIISILHT